MNTRIGRIVACSVAVVLAVPLAGSAGATAAKKPLPLVKLKEARKVVANAVRLDLDAGGSNDIALLGRYSTGLALEAQTGLLAQAAAANETGFELYESKVIDVLTVRTTKYPRYFIALIKDTYQGGDTGKRPALYVQEAKGDPWLWDRYLADPLKGFPQFAVDKDGYVRTDVQARKLLFNPETAPDELAEFLTLGFAPPENADLFAASEDTTGYREDTLDYLEDFGEAGGFPGYEGSFVATPSAHDVFIFRLKDGSALVSFGITSVTKVSHREPNPEIAIDQDGARDTLDPRVAPGLYREFTENALEDFTVLVPTKRSRKKATAINFLYGPISVSAVPVADPNLYE